MTALWIAVIVLWILVVVLAVVVFALARQVGVLYERVAPAGALMVNAQLTAGDAAPQITATTLAGDPLMIADPGRSQLLFFLAPDCPICKSLLPVLSSLRRQHADVTFALLSDGEDPDEHRRYVEAHQLDDYPYALSEAAGRAYGVAKLPYAVLIAADGNIAALGIVNSREHLESLFEAQRLGVASIQEYLDGQNATGVQSFTPEPTAGPNP